MLLFFLINAILSTGIFLLALLVTFAICLVKRKRKKINDIKEIEKVEDNDMYGTYGLSGEGSDYTTVEDVNDYYGI